MGAVPPQQPARTLAFAPVESGIETSRLSGPVPPHVQIRERALLAAAPAADLLPSALEPRRLSGPPEPDSVRFKAATAQTLSFLSGPPEPYSVRFKAATPQPSGFGARQVQQGRRMARYIGANVVDSSAGLAQGAARLITNVSQQPTRQPAGAWQGWNSHSLQAQSAQPFQQEGAGMMDDSSRSAAAADARRNARADAASAVSAADSSNSTPVPSGKRTVIKETRRQLSRSEAVEKGILPDASAVPATVMSQTADKENEDKGLSAAPPAPPPAPTSTAKSEVKTEMYGAEAQRADVMEARKRAYQLTSEIASERTENAKLREALREEKSKARAAARASKKQVEGLQRQAGLKFSNVLNILD